MNISRTWTAAAASIALASALLPLASADGSPTDAPTGAVGAAPVGRAGEAAPPSAIAPLTTQPLAAAGASDVATGDEVPCTLEDYTYTSGPQNGVVLSLANCSLPTTAYTLDLDSLLASLQQQTDKISADSLVWLIAGGSQGGEAGPGAPPGGLGGTAMVPTSFYGLAALGVEQLYYYIGARGTNTSLNLAAGGAASTIVTTTPQVTQTSPYRAVPLADVLAIGGGGGGGAPAFAGGGDGGVAQSTFGSADVGQGSPGRSVQDLATPGAGGSSDGDGAGGPGGDCTSQACNGGNGIGGFGGSGAYGPGNGNAVGWINHPFYLGLPDADGDFGSPPVPPNYQYSPGAGASPVSPDVNPCDIIGLCGGGGGGGYGGGGAGGAQSGNQAAAAGGGGGSYAQAGTCDIAPEFPPPIPAGGTAVSLQGYVKLLVIYKSELQAVLCDE